MVKIKEHCYCRHDPGISWACCKCNKVKCVPDQENPVCTGFDEAIQQLTLLELKKIMEKSFYVSGE